MRLFPIVEEENSYFNDKEGYIELVKCPIGHEFCIEHLNFINKRMHISRAHWLNKNFPQSLEELQVAYNKTAEINQPSCLSCAGLFRETITKSLEAKHEDLKKMVSGFFRAKRFQSSYELASSILEEFKMEK